jgi:GNAT superfamily N-acetyltransferase
MTVDYRNLSNSTLETDIVLALIHGTTVAYSRVFWEDFRDGTRAYHSFGFVHPDWRRKGIGRAMLRHNERRNLEIGAEHAAAGDTHERQLVSGGHDANVGNEALLRSEGYTASRHFHHMVRPDLEGIEVPPLPDGLEVRPGTDDQARALFAADAEAFRDHWGGVDDSEPSFQRWRQQPTWDASLWVVAWDSDEIAGAVLNLIDPQENEEQGYLRGWLDSVFVRRPWRQRGLARALIGRSLELLRDRGMTSAQLGVDVDNENQALHLYEGAGFGVHQSETAWRKPWPVG